MNKHVAVLLGAIALLGVGEAYAADLVVGVSWNNFQEERWKTDEAAIRKVLDAAGVRYISTDAQSSPAKQLADVASLIAGGANAIILLAQDPDAIRPAVQRAVDDGIPVIGYDRLIENPKAFYLTFDNRQVGQLEAEAIFAQVPKGNYAFIKGNSADPNADFVRAGQQDVVGAALAAGDIHNVGESYTDDWDPANAQKEMEQILAKANNRVDAVLVENDGMAGGVIAALAAQGLAGRVAVSGQDGDHAALNRVALGTQTVTVWKDGRDLGERAATIAVELARGRSIDQVPDSVIFAGGPRHIPMRSVFLKPVAITRANLDVVIDAGWIGKAEVCKDVPAGRVPVCG